jgi:N-acetylneuraminic acid mutarotase
MKRFHYAKIRFVLVGVVIIGLLSMASVCPATGDTWKQKADMPTARCTFSTGVVNERIYAIGGAKGRTDALRSVPLQIVEEYHPATDTWTRKADMPTARNALCVSVVDGRIFAIGGSEGIAAPLDTVEEYNPETDTWTRKADMPTARYALSTSAVNGKIYAIGGSMGGFQALSIVEQYDPVTDIWTRKADMPTARIHVSTSVADGKIYAIGGVTGKSASASRAVEQYDPATDTWTRKANMPSAGCTLSTSVVNGKIYAMGGSSPMPALAPLSTVQEYNPVTDTWTNKAAIPTARSGLSTSAVNGKIYAIGGLANPTGMALATVEEYDTGLRVPSPDFEGMRPVADAGSSRYAGPDPVVLDGTGSYDPDDSGKLSYTWQQISGPSVVIIDANTATPTIAGSIQQEPGRNPTPKPQGFTQTDEIQECEFELLVSDGELTSLPDSVKIIIVPDFGTSTLRLENTSFDKDKPTVIYFGGGDCINGYSGQPWNGGSAWMDRANVIGFPSGYTPDSDSTVQTYYKYGDMIIVYLSSVAPEYKQPIHTIGWSTGGMPAMDVGIHLNRVYKDARYAVNRVTHLEAPCLFLNYSWDVHLQAIDLFLTSLVAGEQCWLDEYYGTESSKPEYQKYLPYRTGDFLLVYLGLAHNQVRDWYRNSLTGNDMNIFNSGVVGGAYWSVIGPGKNLQLSPEPGVYYFQWSGSAQTGAMNLFSQSQYPGRLPEPVTLIGPVDGEFVDANGVVLTCEISENAIGYQLLFGSEPYRVMDYTIASDAPEPPNEVITTFPFEQTFWTVRVYDEYGSTIYADPICIYPEIVDYSTEILVHTDEDDIDNNEQ